MAKIEQQAKKRRVNLKAACLPHLKNELLICGYRSHPPAILSKQSPFYGNSETPFMSTLIDEEQRPRNA